MLGLAAVLLVPLLVALSSAAGNSAQLVVGPCQAHNTHREQGGQYGVVIDLGSSGSRAYIYIWEVPLLPADSLPHLVRPAPPQILTDGT
jgi:hypothetical protein